MGTKLLRVFWLLVGLGTTWAGVNALLEGFDSFIPWTVFLMGVAITLIAIFGARSMLKAIQL